MDQQLIRKSCEKFFLKHNYYQNFPEKIEELIETYTNKINNELNYFWENDIEIYNKFHDQSKVFQSDVIINFLEFDLIEKNKIIDDNNLEQLNEFVLDTILFGVSFSMTFYVIKALTTRTRLFDDILHLFKTIGMSIFNPFNKIGKKLTKWTDDKIISYSIVKRNSDECYLKCGIDPKDIPALYGALKETDRRTNINFNIVINNKKAKTNYELGACLRECYITNLIDIIVITANSYIACLKSSKKTNELLSNFKIDERTPMSLTLSNIKVDGACSEIYTTLIEQINSFNKILDFLYDMEDSIKDKMDYKIELNNRLQSIFSTQLKQPSLPSNTNFNTKKVFK